MPMVKKVERKDSTNPLNSYHASFLLADIDNTDLLGAVHTSHGTISIVTAQKILPCSCR